MIRIRSEKMGRHFTPPLMAVLLLFGLARVPAAMPAAMRGEPNLGAGFLSCHLVPPAIRIHPTDHSQNFFLWGFPPSQDRARQPAMRNQWVGDRLEIVDNSSVGIPGISPDNGPESTQQTRVAIHFAARAEAFKEFRQPFTLQRDVHFQLTRAGPAPLR